MKVLDLFSAAAGGWSLGMHRAGEHRRRNRPFIAGIFLRALIALVVDPRDGPNNGGDDQRMGQEAEQDGRHQQLLHSPAVR